MATWTKIAALALVLGAWPRPVDAWGPVGHEAVTARAIETLPKGLREFFKSHRLELPTLALESTAPADTPERRFFVDRLLPYPFADLPQREEAFRERFGVAADEVGRLPWLVQESYGRLVEAFRAGEKDRILGEADTLAALVAELCNPLALSRHHDGTETGQHGLYQRFAVKLPEAMTGELKLSTDDAHLLENPQAHAFSLMSASYVWVDNVLFLEELAARGKPGYGSIYYDAAKLRMGELLKERLSRAADAVGSYWYTAWTAAGRPPLK